jgi:hypothetical protein
MYLGILSRGRLAAVAGLLVPGGAFAQGTTSPAPSGILTGLVSSDSLGNRQLAGAEVSIPALQATGRANFVGEYRMTKLAPGRYLVIVSAAGYRSIGDSVTITASGETYQDFVLVTRITTLDSVRTTATVPPRAYISSALRGFEERRKEGAGHFIGEDELRRLDNEKLSEVLGARIPGIRLMADGTAMYMASMRNGKVSPNGIMLPPPKRGTTPLDMTLTRLNACWVTVYIDDVRIYDFASSGAVNPPDFNSLEVSRFAGVEFYAGGATLPPKYNATASDCGTLLLWTRER